MFCKTKDRIAKEQREDVIYFIVIRNIGQTKRLFRTRLKEHWKTVFFSKKEYSTLSDA